MFRAICLEFLQRGDRGDNQSCDRRTCPPLTASSSELQLTWNLVDSKSDVKRFADSSTRNDVARHVDCCVVIVRRRDGTPAAKVSTPYRTVGGFEADARPRRHHVVRSSARIRSEAARSTAASGGVQADVRGGDTRAERRRNLRICPSGRLRTPTNRQASFGTQSKKATKAAAVDVSGSTKPRWYGAAE